MAKWNCNEMSKLDGKIMPARHVFQSLQCCMTSRTGLSSTALLRNLLNWFFYLVHSDYSHSVAQ